MSTKEVILGIVIIIIAFAIIFGMAVAIVYPISLVQAKTFNRVHGTEYGVMDFMFNSETYRDLQGRTIVVKDTK